MKTNSRYVEIQVESKEKKKVVPKGGQKHIKELENVEVLGRREHRGRTVLMESTIWTHDLV